MPGDAREFFRSTLCFLALLRSLLQLEDHPQVCLSRLKRSLELLELGLGLPVLTLLERPDALNGSRAKNRLDRLAPPELPNVHKVPLAGRDIAPHVESALHVFQTPANAEAAEGRSRQAEPNRPTNGLGGQFSPHIDHQFGFFFISSDGTKEERK